MKHYQLVSSGHVLNGPAEQVVIHVDNGKYNVECQLYGSVDNHDAWYTAHLARFPVTPAGLVQARLSAAFMACMYAED